MRKERITFVLPSTPFRTSGGSKIVFQYANRFVKRGYDVKILFLCDRSLSSRGLPEWLRRLICSGIVAVYPLGTELSPWVKKRSIFHMCDDNVKDGDYIVATSYETSNPVYHLSEKKGKKIYFIQDYENWTCSDKEVQQTYQWMKNVVISRWLEKIVDQYSGKKSICISNCIDTDKFGIDIPIKKRDALSIAALYHRADHKGFKYTWKAIQMIKERYPNVRVRCFGLSKKPKWMPNWVNYTENANYRQLRRIYNDTAIFICSSIDEGYGLTGAESMACGCALASTAYRGVFEYAVDNENALLSPVKDVDAMVKNIDRLIHDKELRVRLAVAGRKTIEQMSWEKAVTIFEKQVLHSEE